MSFSDDIIKFSKKTNESVEQVMRASAISMFSTIVQRTPVDTGRARANWLYTQDTPSSSTVESGPDKREADTGSSSKIAQEIKPGSKHIITNNLPYIEKLESGDGSSQAPRGMVKVSVTEFKAMIKEAVREV